MVLGVVSYMIIDIVWNGCLANDDTVLDKLDSYLEQLSIQLAFIITLQILLESMMSTLLVWSFSCEQAASKGFAAGTNGCNR